MSKGIICKIDTEYLKSVGVHNIQIIQHENKFIAYDTELAKKGKQKVKTFNYPLFAVLAIRCGYRPSLKSDSAI